MKLHKWRCASAVVALYYIGKEEIPTFPFWPRVRHGDTKMVPVGTDVGSFGAKSVAGRTSCWSRTQEGGCWVPTVETWGRRAGSSRVDGSKAGRRPVAPSYRALQAGGRERAEKLATREFHLKKSFLMTSTGWIETCGRWVLHSFLSFDNFWNEKKTLCLYEEEKCRRRKRNCSKLTFSWNCYSMATFDDQFEKVIYCYGKCRPVLTKVWHWVSHWVRFSCSEIPSSLSSHPETFFPPRERLSEINIDKTCNLTYVF